MRTILAIAILLTACMGKKENVSDTTAGDTGISPDSMARAHKIAYKASTDTIYDEQGGWCLVQSKVHFIEVNVGDIKADSFCKWQPAK